MQSTDDQPPPFLHTWPRVYAAVIGYLSILITALALVSHLLEP